LQAVNGIFLSNRGSLWSQMAFSSHDGESSDTREDKIASAAAVQPDSASITRESEKGINDALSRLSDKEKQLLELLQKNNGNDAAVARELGVSREAIRKRHKALYNKLAEAANLNVSRYQEDAPQMDPMTDREQKVAEEIKSLTNGFRFDTISIVTTRQAMERNIKHLPEKVKENLLKSFDAAVSKKRSPGYIRPMEPSGFVTAMTAFGFKRDGSSSVYMTVGDNTARIAYHNASAKTFKKHGETGNSIVSISIRKHHKKFESDNSVHMVEYVFPLETVTKEKLAGLIYDMGNFFATGEYTDHVGIAEFHAAGSESFKDQAMRKAVADQRAAVIAKYQSTPQWRKAPNDKDSNLTEDQWIAVRTPFFKEYFGDWENDPEHASKVLDENGEPKVVHHGTNANFFAFDKNKLGAKNIFAESAPRRTQSRIRKPQKNLASRSGAMLKNFLRKPSRNCIIGSTTIRIRHSISSF